MVIIRASGGWLAAVALLVLLAGCADRQRRNPLDPEAIGAAFTVGDLTAVAGNGKVVLSWDYSRFSDINGIRLIRKIAGPASVDGPLVRELKPDVVEFVDEQVVNGTTYSYQLALDVEGEDGRLLPRTRLATPGTESAWVADVETNLVWKLAPDGRAALFGTGSFPDIRALAVNSVDGSCWISDRFLARIIRISSDGDDKVHPIELEEPGDLSVSPDGTTGWVFDRAQRRVYSFRLVSESDSAGGEEVNGLPAEDIWEVDASFAGSVMLSATKSACWIGDAIGERILLIAEDGSRLGEWTDLEDLGHLAAGSASTRPLQAEAWALVRSGTSLIHIADTGIPAELDLPFDTGIDVDVDAVTGHCWVLGRSDEGGGIALFDRQGHTILLWEELPLMDTFAVDGMNGHLWLAGSSEIWKTTVNDEEVVRLAGFSQPVFVDIDSGAR